MASLSRRRIALSLHAGEILIFAAAFYLSYLSESSRWLPFWAWATISTIIFIAIKIAQIKPEILDIVASENRVTRMTTSAYDYGIIDFYNMQITSDQNRRNEATQEVIKAAGSMWLCANSGASYLDPAIYRHWPAIEARLKSGIPFKVVLLDPHSPDKALRNLLNIGQEANDSKINIPNLITLHNKYNSLEIRFIERGMYGTVFLTPTNLFYDPYQLALIGHRIENRSFCLQMEPKTVGQGICHYEIFKSHFEALWRQSVDFEEWIDRNHSTTPNLPKLARRHSHRQHHGT